MRVLGAILGLLLIAMCVAAPSPGRAQSAPRESKVGALLSQTDYKFRKHNDVTWSTPVTIGKLGERKLIVSHNDEIVVVFVIPRN